LASKSQICRETQADAITRMFNLQSEPYQTAKFGTGEMCGLGARGRRGCFVSFCIVQVVCCLENIGLKERSL